MAKIGRPKSENPKDKMIGVRFNKDEYEDLLSVSECLHMNVQDSIRHLISSNAKCNFSEKKRGE